MNRIEIIKEFTDNIEAFQKLAFNVSGEQDSDDLMQTCTLMLLEFPEDRLISYYNPNQGLKPFFIRLLCNQYRSKTSHFHKLYRKEEINLNNKKEDILLNEPQSLKEFEPGYFEQINEACQSIYTEAGCVELAELEKTVWGCYVETGSLRKTLAALPDEYADLVDLKTIHVIVKKFRRTIKQKLQAED